MGKTLINKINGNKVVNPINVWNKKITEDNYEKLINEEKQIANLLGKKNITYLNYFKGENLKIDVSKKRYNKAKKIVETYYQNQ